MHHQGSTEAHEAWPGSVAGAQDVAAKVHRCQHFVIKAPLRTCGRAWLWLPEAHGVQPSWLTGVPPVGAQSWEAASDGAYTAGDLLLYRYERKYCNIRGTVYITRRLAVGPPSEEPRPSLTP